MNLGEPCREPNLTNQMRACARPDRSGPRQTPIPDTAAQPSAAVLEGVRTRLDSDTIDPDTIDPDTTFGPWPDHRQIRPRRRRACHRPRPAPPHRARLRPCRARSPLPPWSPPTRYTPYCEHPYWGCLCPAVPWGAGSATLRPSRERRGAPFGAPLRCHVPWSARHSCRPWLLLEVVHRTAGARTIVFGLLLLPRQRR